MRRFSIEVPGDYDWLGESSLYSERYLVEKIPVCGRIYAWWGYIPRLPTVSPIQRLCRLYLPFFLPGGEPSSFLHTIATELVVRRPTLVVGRYPVWLGGDPDTALELREGVNKQILRPRAVIEVTLKEVYRTVGHSKACLDPLHGNLHCFFSLLGDLGRSCFLLLFLAGSFRPLCPLRLRSLFLGGRYGR